MVYVLGNAIVLLLSMLLLWIASAHEARPLTMVEPQELQVVLVGVAAVLFVAAAWREVASARSRRSEHPLAKELAHERRMRESLEERLNRQDARLADREQLQMEREQLVSREAEHLSEIENLRKALKQAEARREQESASHRAYGGELIHLLSRLQEKGRFVDFVMEEIGGYSDQQVGTAARFVHDGCRAVVREYLDLAPVHEGAEGAAVTVAEPSDATEIRFLGRSATTYPVTGRLVHRGWKVVASRLPQMAKPTDLKGALEIVAPAQVELT